MKFLPRRLLFLKVCAPSEFCEGQNQLCNERQCNLILLLVWSNGEGVLQYPSSLVALFIVPNLPPAIEADHIPPNVREDTLNAGARHHPISIPFHSLYSSVHVDWAQSGLQGRAWILFAKVLTGRYVRGGLLPAAILTSWGWMLRCLWLCLISKLFFSFYPWIFTSFHFLCLNQLPFLSLLGKGENETKQNV